jgi:hypothetical protein
LVSVLNCFHHTQLNKPKLIAIIGLLKPTINQLSTSSSKFNSVTPSLRNGGSSICVTKKQSYKPNLDQSVLKNMATEHSKYQSTRHKMGLWFDKDANMDTSITNLNLIKIKMK